MNILDYIISNEKNAECLFSRWESEAGDPNLREIFQLLASTEHRHINELESLKGEIEPRDAESILLSRISGRKSGFARLLEDSAGLRGDEDAFNQVMVAEEEEIRLLEGLARHEQRPETRELLTMLAEDEKKHMETIIGIYDFVESPRTYLEWGEFSNLHPL